MSKISRGDNGNLDRYVEAAKAVLDSVPTPTHSLPATAYGTEDSGLPPISSPHVVAGMTTIRQAAPRRLKRIPQEEIRAAVIAERAERRRIVAGMEDGDESDNSPDVNIRPSPLAFWPKKKKLTINPSPFSDISQELGRSGRDRRNEVPHHPFFDPPGRHERNEKEVKERDENSGHAPRRMPNDVIKPKMHKPHKDDHDPNPKEALSAIETLASSIVRKADKPMNRAAQASIADLLGTLPLDEGQKQWFVDQVHEGLLDAKVFVRDLRSAL
jgi:hypothetical protein